MPTRMIRGDLLDSDRYWSVSIEARQLFVHLMLLADDFGCVSLAPVFVRRRCFADAPQHDLIDKLIQQLHDADLIRIYQDDGARYGFIPRFKQRLQRRTLKHPKPPEALFKDDEHAINIFREIKGVTKKSTDGAPLGNGYPSTEEKRREEEVEDEGKGKEKNMRAAPVTDESARERGRLAGLLRDRGVLITPANPLLVEWQAAEVTEAEAIEAVERARLNKPAPDQIPARYLDPIVREVLLERGNARRPVFENGVRVGTGKSQSQTSLGIAALQGLKRTPFKDPIFGDSTQERFNIIEHEPSAQQD